MPARSAASVAAPLSRIASPEPMRLLEPLAGRRAAGERGDDPVASSPDAGLQGAHDVAGADELLPAGEHLAAQQRAVVDALLHR